MIAIITDSTSDLSAELKERYSIVSVPLYVLFGGEMHRDDIDITTAQLFKGIKEGQKMPSTSQPSPAEFAAVYAEALKTADEVLSLHISGQLSGTVGSARLAAQDFGGKVTVFDTGSASMGLGLMAVRAAQLARDGKSVAEIVSELETIKAKSYIVFTVETLEFLRRNGRIGGAQALLGGLLNIKPILSVKGGRVESSGRERGQKKATANLIAQARDYIAREGRARLAFVHTPGGEDNILEVKAALLGADFEDAGTYNFGAVVGTHTGPGTYGIVMEPLSA
ncbi:fatty acid-binding protein DegV [Deinococcus irradiatisoli]|uniref:Fatty acid-binding protein DegV n=1 Tax=Deinococcus irradiatisoli TaxID=2202254 RepID=A0A2Z3JHA8_9DEIO|nr:DegV family protein [Deinococcus irradiatisoli]AWN22911.1 fatty acid-binding protein DegV [Deinococcus irradiatisoli]